MFRRIICLCLTVALTPLPTGACTLWATAGDAAAGGTLISKNRDWKPDHRQYLKITTPKNGYAYFGLYAEGNDDPGLKAGVNNQGLTVVSASSNIPKKVRKDEPGKSGIMREILSSYASVDALLADADKVFPKARANFYLISDRTQVLQVEVGLQGNYAVKVAASGTLSHTNHYLDPALAALYNRKIGVSSATRYQRINTLLGEYTSPYGVADFAALSHDQHDGPDNSVWRTGKEHTMASWIVRTPAQGAPQVHLVINNPDEAPSTQDFVLDDAFWQRKFR